MKTLYLIRHGETESNRKGIFRGRLNIPLSEAGRRQARDLKKFFEKIHVEAVYTSPLKRAVETAEIVFPRGQIIRDHNLNNLDLGSWSGREKARVKEETPELWERWITTPEQMEFPEGETLNQVYQRAGHFLEMFKTSPHREIAAVSHRAVAKVILAAGIGLEKNYFWRFHLDNCSVSRIIFDEGRGFTLFKLNETHFLGHTLQEWY